MPYGQFCPIAKATEIIGGKWSLPVILELLMGGRRFNELQRWLRVKWCSCPDFHISTTEYATIIGRELHLDNCFSNKPQLNTAGG